MVKVWSGWPVSHAGLRQPLAVGVTFGVEVGDEKAFPAAGLCGLCGLAGRVPGAWLGAGATRGRMAARPIRIVVPYPPGTGPDVMARLVSEGLARELKATFVVENKPGANAIIGTGEVAKAPADGHTFLLVDRLTLSVNPLLYKPLPFDPKKDLVSVSNIADVDLYLVVSARVPAGDFRSFIDYAKARPGTGSLRHRRRGQRDAPQHGTNLVAPPSR